MALFCKFMLNKQFINNLINTKTCKHFLKMNVDIDPFVSMYHLYHSSFRVQYPEAYIEPSRISAMKVFCKNS